MTGFLLGLIHSFNHILLLDFLRPRFCSLSPPDFSVFFAFCSPCTVSMGSLLVYIAHSCYETVVDKYKENVNTYSRMSNYFDSKLN